MLPIQATIVFIEWVISASSLLSVSRQIKTKQTRQESQIARFRSSLHLVRSYARGLVPDNHSGDATLHTRTFGLLFVLTSCFAPTETRPFPACPSPRRPRAALCVRVRVRSVYACHHQHRHRHEQEHHRRKVRKRWQEGGGGAE